MGASDRKADLVLVTSVPNAVIDGRDMFSVHKGVPLVSQADVPSIFVSRLNREEASPDGNDGSKIRFRPVSDIQTWSISHKITVCPGPANIHVQRPFKNLIFQVDVSQCFFLAR